MNRRNEKARAAVAILVRPSLRSWLFAAALLSLSTILSAQSVRITLKPEGLVHGDLMVPISTSEPVTRVELFVNGVKWSEGTGRSMVIPVKLGDYVRRIRIRAVGYDASQKVIGEDQMVVNDPKPPYHVRLHANGTSLEASISKPPGLEITAADFFIGEEKLATVTAAPWTVTWDATRFPKPLYARVAVHSADGQEANDVFFFGSQPSGEIEVTLQQLPLSLAGSGAAPRVEDLVLLDNGRPRKIETLVPASDQPLNVILLIDYSESMLKELPVVKAAAKQFAQTLLRPQGPNRGGGLQSDAVLADAIHERLQRSRGIGRSRQAGRRDAPVRLRHRDAVRAAEAAGTTCSGDPDGWRGPSVLQEHD